MHDVNCRERQGGFCAQWVFNLVSSPGRPRFLEISRLCSHLHHQVGTDVCLFLSFCLCPWKRTKVIPLTHDLTRGIDEDPAEKLWDVWGRVSVGPAHHPLATRGLSLSFQKIIAAWRISVPSFSHSCLSSQYLGTTHTVIYLICSFDSFCFP